MGWFTLVLVRRGLSGFSQGISLAVDATNFNFKRMKLDMNLIVVNYWHSKNIYCKNVLVNLARIKQKFPENTLRIVALNPFENETLIENFNQLNDGIEYMKDHTGTYLFYQITRFPSILILTQEGRIIFRQDGIKSIQIHQVEYCLSSSFLNLKQLNLSMNP